MEAEFVDRELRIYGREQGNLDFLKKAQSDRAETSTGRHSEGSAFVRVEESSARVVFVDNDIEMVKKGDMRPRNTDSSRLGSAIKPKLAQDQNSSKAHQFV